MTKPKKKNKKKRDNDNEIAEEVTDLLTDEIPVYGTLKRIYKYVRKQLTKELREEIEKLEERQESLLDTIQQITRQNKDLQALVEEQKECMDNYDTRIATLESELKEYQEEDKAERAAGGEIIDFNKPVDNP